MKIFTLAQLKHLIALFAITLALALSSASTGFAQTKTDVFTKVDQNFDHSRTKFPLHGAHVNVTCETCHTGGIFKGVPSSCASCHNGEIGKGKPQTHPRTEAECGQCHNQTSWVQVHVDHTPIIDGCFTCHDKKIATGKTANHIKTNTKCENCHVTSTWRVSQFDHILTVEPCEVCHDRLHATGKPFNHIRSSNDCASCHKSVSWKVGVFDHTGITTGCFKCHDGISATGKSPSHINTNNNCEACHSTIAWFPAHFDHSATTITVCVDCHDGIRATGRSFAHFKTTDDCAACHQNFVAWKPAVFDHNLALDLSNCVTCHNGTHQPADGKTKNHIPSSNTCTDCHSPTNFTTWAGAKFLHVGITTNCISCHDGKHDAMNAMGKNPTHLGTTNACESCHAIGVNWATTKFDHTQISGTATACVSCHNGSKTTSLSGNKIVGKLQGPTGKHISTPDATTNMCDSCHNTNLFVPANKFDHGQLANNACFNCHNGSTVVGGKTLTTKGPNHIASGTDCETCHTSFTVWSAKFDHSGIGAARCDSCHNNNPVMGMTPTHLVVNGGIDCKACHTATTSWTLYKFDHSVVSTVCLSCHNGTTSISSKGLLTSKPTKHIPISTGCESCHTSFTTWVTKFDHTTTTATCISCHDGVTATGQLSISGHHIPASTTCNNCHVTTSWYRPAEKMDHADATAQGKSCATCHNGTDATNKGSKHILSSSLCETCHKSTANWLAVMDHTDPTVAKATCFSCHDGAHSDVNPINGKSINHVKTSNLCADCHTTVNWTTLSKFDHTQAIGTCFSCHDGIKATGKLSISGKHVASSTDCAVCHSTTNWTAKFDHTDVTVAATACITCHNGTVAKALSKNDAPMPGHVVSSDACQDCHTTAAFKPAHFDHNDPTVVGKPCATCHDTGKPNAVVRPVTHPPLAGQDCAACHTTATWVTSGKPDHSTFVGNCITCHTGLPKAKGKVDAPNHLPTSNNCDVCHNTNLFKPAVFDHNEGAPPNSLNCVTCHDGAPAHLPAFGKSSFPSHPTTSNTCSNCHSGYVTWVTTKFDHTDTVVSKATCISCHDGAHPPAIAKTVTHFKTSNDCALCHNTTKFKPMTKFDHTDSVVSAATCLSCHDGAHPPALSKLDTPAPGHLPTSNLCGDCHTTISFKGAKFDHSTVVAGTCFTCHNGARATGKTPTHFATNNTCDDCHGTTVWIPAKAFPHGSTVTPTNCNSCHTGTRPPAVGKGPKHILSTTACQSCHTDPVGKASPLWTVLPAKVDHTQVVGSCFSCHNGTIATGKSPTHFATSNNCDSCHTTLVWKPVPSKQFDHTQAVGACFTCHNGTKAPVVGKTPTHMTTTNTCDACHTTVVWKPVSATQFDHSQAVGTCANCHNGSHPPAVAKGTGHFITTQACDVCHTTINWTTLLTYTHISPTYVKHSATVMAACVNCHKQNNEKITMIQPGLAPDCAACHANNFKAGSHPKFGNTNYTFTELRDCTGACHIYKDQTLTTITKSQTGHHKATNGSF